MSPASIQSVLQMNSVGESDYSEVFEYIKTGIYESTENDGIQIYPNPCDGEITIELNNPEYQYISLSITDIFGREVKSLFSGYKAPGNISFIWNTNAVIDGVYFCRLTLGDESFVKAVVLAGDILFVLVPRLKPGNAPER